MKERTSQTATGDPRPGGSIPDDERERLAGWNDTPQPYPDQVTVHELFDRQADETPDAAALLLGEDVVTFADLQRRANRLAHHLVGQGVGPEVPVGVAMRRSPEMIVAMLAILKAGGAYLPLDPAYPDERLALMIEDADVGLILTGPDVVGLPDTRAAVIDVHAFDGSAHASDSPAVRSTPDDTMFIIFTSGSTGRPKGVLGTHRGMLNRFAWQWQTYPFSEGEVCCQKTSLNFVDHLWETWGPLLKGHALVLIPDEVVKDGRRFVEVLAQHRIERLVTVPSLMSTLLRAVPDVGRKLSHLRYCTLSGERLTAELAAELDAALPDTVLLNLYGMSEASADATWYDQRWGSQSDALPIGRPIHNMRVYLLDAERRPVSIGETGEIYLGGVGLAKGYLGRPELTAERFLPDPFVDDPDARMYRSGDLGRWLPEGLLEFVGRVDHQVKVRGIRVELGEVEAAARALDEVDDVVVTAPRIGFEAQLVAYIVAAAGHEPGATRIRGALASRLPEHMVPARFVFLDQMPLNPHGKVDRDALPDAVGERPASDVPYAPPRTAVERRIAQVWKELLLVDPVGVNDSFFDLGGDSLLVVRLQSHLEEELGVEVTATDIFEDRTIRRLAARIDAAGTSPTAADERAAPGTLASVRPRLDGTDVAIIGMAGRFPGAPDLDRFWDNLANGVESLRRLTEEELRAFEPDYEAKLRDPDFVPVVGTLDDVEMFDAEFFGIGRGEARTLDPQHRIWFETAWQALEHGGYAPGKTEHRIGVFAGSYMNTYTMHNLLHDRASVEAFVRMQSPAAYMQMLANDRDYLPTRTSHLLDLRGPAVNVQTACSTALVAVVLACRAIASGDCDMALAGGVTVLLPQEQGYFHQTGGIRSIDGHCRPFDAAGTGTLFTSGVGAVLLKGLDQALADGDNVLAVIKGAAMNNDGAHKASYMAPSIDGQVDVIVDAQRRAGVDPATIGYVEAHGTATPLGDPIEVAALTRAFNQTGDSPRKVALGSVKSNIGHTDAAAGVAGLIKAVLALRHEAIPPTLNFTTPNPEIDFESSPFRVPDRLEPWPAGPEPRRAGVSSFGVGGTNAHVIVEEAPPSPEAVSSRPRHLLPLSARSETALAAMRQRLADHLEAERPPLADVGHTLIAGRVELPHRMAVVAADVDEAIEALRSERAPTSRVEIDEPDVVMMFPGQGSQFVGMGQELHEHEPVYREALDQCATILEPLLGIDLRDVLHPSDASDAEAARRLTQTGLAQPAIFAVSYATARLWSSWGVEPSALVGHSVGEYVAATLAGVFTLEGALTVIAERARLMQDLPGGSMRAVRLSADAVEPYLGDGVALAAVNTPKASVVSGPDDAIQRFVERLDSEGLDTIELHTSHAFHSEMMEPILDRFRDVVASVERTAPSIPIVSTLSGELLGDAEAVDPDYWARQVRHPVRFSDAVMTLHQEPHRVYLEVGPGRTLCGAVLQHPNGQAGDARIAVIDSLGHPSERAPALGALLGALGKVWGAGAPVASSALYEDERRRRVPLPTYPFERQRYWVDPPPLVAQASPPASTQAHPADAPAPAAAPVEPAPGPNGSGHHDRIADQLAAIIADVNGFEAPDIDRTASFTDLGLDSLSALRVVMEANRVGISLPPDSIFLYGSIAELASAAGGAGVREDDQEVVTGPTPFTPGQLRYLEERRSPEPHHWNLSSLVCVERLDPDALRAALRALLSHHDALRLRLWREDGRWRQEIAPPPAEIPLSSYDVSEQTVEQRSATIERVTAELQGSFDLGEGLLLRAAHFRCGPDEPDRLFVTVHHFAVDGMTWAVLWGDLEQAYHQALAGDDVFLPPKTTSMQEWGAELERLARTPDVIRTGEAWMRKPWHEVSRLPLDLDADASANTNASAAVVEVELSEHDTFALLDGPERPDHVIITALAACVSAWTSSPTVLIDLLSHGRHATPDGFNLSRTLGFTLRYNPLLLSHPTWEGTRETLGSIRTQIDESPEGYAFDLLRFLSPDAELRGRLNRLPRADVLFNYAGAQAGSRETTTWRDADEPTGPDESPRGLRQHPIAVRATLTPNLILTFVYSRALHRSDTIEATAAEVVDTIRRLSNEPVAAG